MPVATSRSSLFKTLFDSVPRIRPKRRVSEGIIAPRTPVPSAPSSPMAAVFGQSQHYPTSPMLSPGLGPPGDQGLGRERYSQSSLGKFEAQSRLTPGLKLGTPPRRSTTGPMDYQKGFRGSKEDLSGKPAGATGLGFRRQANSEDHDANIDHAQPSSRGQKRA